MMKNKKITIMIAAVVVTVGIVGGTLAWFTSSDSIVNNFTTGEVKEKIEENFTEPENWLPGDEVNKDVWVNNTGKSDAFIRVWFEVKVENLDGNLDVMPANKIEENIELKFTDFVTGSNPKWMADGEDSIVENTYTTPKYYYSEIVSSKEVTERILDSVTLKNTAGNEWINKKILVTAYSDAIQTANKAYESWEINNQEIIALYESLSPVNTQDNN